jgi:hypothetical protein
MEIKELLDIVNESEEFKKFKQEHPESYFVSAFLILDLSSEKQTNNTYQINYCFKEKNKDNSKEKKAAMFSYDSENKKINLNFSEFTKQKKELNLIEINQEIKSTIKELKEIVFKHLEEKSINKKPIKIIFSLNIFENNNKKELIWNLTSFFENLDLIRILVEDTTKEIRKSEKFNLMEMVKKKKGSSKK